MQAASPTHPADHPLPPPLASSEVGSLVTSFLQHTLLDGLWYWNLAAPEQGWVNARFWQTLGYAPEQAPTAPTAWRDHLHPADLAAAWQEVTACSQDATRVYDQVLHCTHASGSPVWLRCRGLLLRDEAGEATWLIGALFDITQQKRQEAYAHEVAAHYGSILKNQSVHIVRTDTQGNYTYVNDFFSERFGKEGENLLGKQSLCNIAVEDHEKCLAVVMQCFAAPEVAHQVVLRKPYRDGSIKANHWEFIGLRDEQGNPSEILCVGYDVTLLLENLHRSQHLLDVTSQQNLRLQNFAYIISHNIRSHSANLTSLVQLLAGAKSKAQREMFLQMLTTSTAKLADTIVNLNEIITVNSNVNKPKVARVLQTEISKTLEALSALIRQHHIAVEVQMADDLTVTVVPAYLDSILLNLISNAIKYRSPNRPALIQLRAHAGPDCVVLTVQDNGLGIDLVKNRAKLFGMYKTFHDNEDARGVGLFITKNQVEAMLGTIDVDSEVNVGSTFTIHFYEI